MNFNFSLAFIILFYPLLLHSSSFYERRGEGWHWYETQESKEEQKDTNEQATPTEKIDLLKKAVEQSLHKAIVYPTQDNIISYIKLQKQIMDQSEKFSDNWQKVLYHNPVLDERTIFPVSNNARHIYLQEERKAKKDAIRNLSREYGLFFFYKGGCKYCHGMAPLIKEFSKKYNWKVLAITLDGDELTEFPDTKRDNGIAENLGITSVPALFAVNSLNKEVIPLAQGMISETEIEDRILLLMEKEK